MATISDDRGILQPPPVVALSASAPLTPLELIQEQPEVDRLTLPTGTTVFCAGEPVQFIHVIERGWVELSSGPLNRIRFGSGELFFYEDLVDGTECHSRDATAVTPVSLFRLSRHQLSGAHPPAPNAGAAIAQQTAQPFAAAAD